MTRSFLLANRLREVLLDGHWIANTNYQEQIQNISWEQATEKVGGLNTIAALTFHINYYLEGLLNVLNGGRLEISDRYSFNLPEIQSEIDWRSLVSRFINHAETFSKKVEQLTDLTLDQSFQEEKYGSYLRNIEGVIEHSYYHLGQIVLIKKLIATSDDIFKCG